MDGRDISLAGRVILITGGGRGLGREHALACAALGAKVIVNDLGGAADGGGASSAPAEEVVATIRAGGGEAVASFGDITDAAAAAAAIALAVAEFGQLDALINNAGILRDKSLLNMTVEDWSSVVDVHLRGTFMMTQAAGRYWRDRAKDGAPRAARIVNMTSGSGLYGNFGQANYAAAKGGIASLTVTASIELARYGVTVNCVAPVARTRLVPQSGAAEGAFDPLDPANVSPLVCWLASDRSGDVTGQTFTAVGGFVGVVEGYHRGPAILHDRRLTVADIDTELPALLAQAKLRTNIRDSHPYIGRI